MCGTHRDAVAGWRCDACNAYRCGKCTARLLSLYTCATCGAPAKQLTVSRRERPATHWVVHTLLFPVRGGLPLVAIVGALLLVIPYVAGLVEAAPHQLDGAVRAARVALLGLFALLAVDAAARGSEPGTPLRFARALVATSPVWGPALAYVIFVGAPTGKALSDPMLVMFGVLAFAYVPMALAVAATDASFGDATNPFTVFELAGRLGRVYLTLLLRVVVTSAAVALAFTLKGPAGTIAQVLTVAMLGCAIGLVPHVHGELMGWGNSSTQSDPLYPRMVAEGRRKLVERNVVDAASGPTTAESSAPVPTSLAEKQEAAKVADALKRDDSARALRMYEARTDWSSGAFDDRTLVALGRAAQRAKKLDLARSLLETAAARPGRGTAQAMLALAQLHATALQQPGEATAIFRRIVDEYPGTDVAKIAALRLEAA